MRDATEEDKRAILDNLREMMGIPVVHNWIFDKLWDHQIPESSTEWITNLANLKDRLADLQEEMDKLKKEYDAQCYLGMGLYYEVTYATSSTEDKYEDTDNQAV